MANMHTKIPNKIYVCKKKRTKRNNFLFARSLSCIFLSGAQVSN